MKTIKGKKVPLTDAVTDLDDIFAKDVGGTEHNSGSVDLSVPEERNRLLSIRADINKQLKETQEYDVISSEEEVSDHQGGTVTEYHCIDKDGLRCSLRLRVEKNDNIQLYVDYNDISFVYNVYILK